MDVEFGNLDVEMVQISIKFTLEVDKWRGLARELPTNLPYCAKLKEYILQMLSEKIDSQVKKI
jgi:hypothetical protein